MGKRVVVTGFGAVTPLGNNVKTSWENIKKGQCGIDFIQAFDTSDFKVKIAAEVKKLDQTDVLSFKEAKRMDRFTQLAIVAAEEAITEAQLTPDNHIEDNWGVIFGTGIGGFITTENEKVRMIKRGPKRVSPFFIPMAISNIAAANLAIKYNLKGICDSVVSACASGASAIHYAFRLLQQGLADGIITGGSEAAISPLALAGFSSMGALCTHNQPKQASLPFDARRTGFVMGEGAGVLVLETWEHAQARNAPIYAEIVGCGTTCDAYHITAPDPEAREGARAMTLAIQEAGIKPKSLSYINAHGTSTIYNDQCETKAIKKVFKDMAYTIPVSSTKSMMAHLLGAAGAVEAIICIMAMQDDFIPPTLGYQQQDPQCDLDYVPQKGRKKALRYTLSNSFGGHNVSLLMKNGKLL